MAINLHAVTLPKGSVSDQSTDCTGHFAKVIRQRHKQQGALNLRTQKGRWAMEWNHDESRIRKNALHMHRKGAAVIRIKKRADRHAARVHPQNIVKVLARNPNARYTRGDTVKDKRPTQRLVDSCWVNICPRWGVLPVPQRLPVIF